MVIFVGGIHGSGKGTICRLIVKQTNVSHFTASEVLNWNDIAINDKDKRVRSFTETQQRLVNGLEKIKSQNKKILLDGHFCLFNSNSKVEKIEFSTFEKIAPSIIIVVTAKPLEIKERLLIRDGIDYDLAVLREMQNFEIDYAIHVSKVLNVPYFEVKDEVSNSLLTTINEL